MKLTEIMESLHEIRDGLWSGKVTFTYDRLATVMGEGHPAENFDEIFCDVDVILEMIGEDADIPMERLQQMVKDLNRFARAYKVKGVRPIATKLKKYIEEHEST